MILFVSVTQVAVQLSGKCMELLPDKVPCAGTQCSMQLVTLLTHNCELVAPGQSPTGSMRNVMFNTMRNALFNTMRNFMFIEQDSTEFNSTYSRRFLDACCHKTSYRFAVIQSSGVPTRTF